MEPETTETTEPTETTIVTTEPTEPQVVVPVEIREMTRVETTQGEIHVIHEITLGDLIVSTVMFALLIFLLINRFTRG